MLFSAKKEEVATYARALTKWLVVWKTRAKCYRGFGLAQAKNVARDPGAPSRPIHPHEGKLLQRAPQYLLPRNERHICLFFLRWLSKKLFLLLVLLKKRHIFAIIRRRNIVAELEPWVGILSQREQNKEKILITKIEQQFSGSNLRASSTFFTMPWLKSARTPKNDEQCAPWSRRVLSVRLHRGHGSF